MFLVIHKESFMVLGFFDTEEKATRYIGGSTTVGIVYLSSDVLTDIKDAINKKEEQLKA
ncbi:MAG: hypothetical protein IPJ01_10540 [Micavibrio sp.]|nr:hypothetical protein [Micavibrio sp.]